MGNGPVAADELRLLVERVERLEAEKKAIADYIKDVFGEAKARGFCAKTMKRIVRERRKTVDQRREEEAMFDLYRGALGMLDGTPLGNWAVEKLTKPKKPEPKGDEPKGDGATGAMAPAGAEPEDDTAEAATAAPAEDIVTLGDARQRGRDAALAGLPVTANPFPPRSPLRAAWDEAWCQELGSDGMEIPEALRPAGKRKVDEAVPAEPDPAEPDEAAADRADPEDAPVPDMPQPSDDPDALYVAAREAVIREQYASITRLQRLFSIGYNRASRFIERLEAAGIISPTDARGRRIVLVDEQGQRR